MFNFLATRTLYIRLKPDWLSMRVVCRNKQSYEYEDIPLIAIEGEVQPYGYVKLGKTLAVGKEAIKIQKNQSAMTLLLNGFEHPRTIISNFEVAALTFKYFVEKTCEEQVSLMSPRMIIQPLEKLEGGLTQIEARALSALGFQAGAREVYIYAEHKFLSDEEVLKIHKNERAIKMNESPRSKIQ